MRKRESIVRKTEIASTRLSLFLDDVTFMITKHSELWLDNVILVTTS